MKQSYLLIIIIAIVAILAIGLYSTQEESFFNFSGDDDSNGGGYQNNDGNDQTPEDENETETPSAGGWELVGTGSEWCFIGSGDFEEWPLDFGDDWVPGRHKIEISRRWNFKDVFECGDEGSVVWCLHDSYDNQIWHRTDTECILNFVTDTIYSGVYDGTPWTFFIGNNYDCDIDPHWSVKFYNWV